MTSPIPPQGPEPGAAKDRAPGPLLKIFVAGIILAIGSAVAVMHRLDDVHEIVRTENFRSDIAEKSFENPLLDPNLEIAPLPSGALKEGDAEKTVAAPIPNKAQAIPQAIPAVQPDSVKEKYAQAYPPPVLIADESLVSKDSEVVSSRPANLMIDEDFRSVRPFTNYKAIAEPKIEKDIQAPPKSENLTPIYDELLPLFRFAENLKSAEDSEQPDNPFQTILISDGADVTVLQPLQPLQPLYTPGEMPDTKVLKPLQPLVSPVPSLKLTPLQPLE